MTKVMVAHPNVQHSYQLAVALQQAELLHSLVTRFYASWKHLPFSLLRWLPPQYRHKIENNLFSKVRRNHPELDLERVSTLNTMTVLALIIMKYSGLISTATQLDLLHKNAHSFQQRVVDMVQHKAEVLVCYDHFAFEAFQLLANSEVKLVLDHSSAHPQTIKQILDEESELYPELKQFFISTIPGLEQACQESALADYILVASNFVRNSCIENGVASEKIFVMPYGINADHFCPLSLQTERQDFRILFVGRIMHLKGIQYLLDAYTKLALPQTELWLCGNIVETVPTLQQFPDDVKRLGHVPYRQMPEIYNQVDVFVLPTLLEGLSQVCIEAMACGKPVITTPNSGLQGILRNGQDGFIVPIRDVEALAEKILYLYENREICVEMGKSARRTAETYTWQRYREQVASVFSQILNE